MIRKRTRSNHDGVGRKRLFKSEEKQLARQDSIIDCWRTVTGKYSIPEDKQYWTLSSWQHHQESEINQVLKNEFLPSINQFHGVDDDLEKIKTNMAAHPNANWHHGDWLKIIKAQKRAGTFNPAILFFDTFRVLHGEKLMYDCQVTMSITPPETLFVVNMQRNNVYNGKKWIPEEFILRLQKDFPIEDRLKWSDLNQLMYEYPSESKKVQMISFFFYRKK